MFSDDKWIIDSRTLISKKYINDLNKNINIYIMQEYMILIGYKNNK